MSGRRLYRRGMPRQAGQPRFAVALIATRYELIRELRTDGETVSWEAFDSALDRPVLLQLIRPELASNPEARLRFEQYRRAGARGPSHAGERILDGGVDPESGQLFVVREWPAPASSAERIPVWLRDSGAAARLRLEDAPRWLVAAVVGVLLVAVVAGVKPGVERWLGWVNAPAGGADPALNLARAAVAPASTSSAATRSPAPAAPSRDPTPPPTTTPLTGQPRKIVNTDGRGVALRSAPGGDRLPGKGYDEGATVQAFEQSGQWTHIRGSDGREGWVLSVTLAPNTP